MKVNGSFVKYFYHLIDENKNMEKQFSKVLTKNIKKSKNNINSKDWFENKNMVPDIQKLIREHGGYNALVDFGKELILYITNNYPTILNVYSDLTGALSNIKTDIEKIIIEDDDVDWVFKKLGPYNGIIKVKSKLDKAFQQGILEGIFTTFQIHSEVICMENENSDSYRKFIVRW